MHLHTSTTGRLIACLTLLGSVACSELGDDPGTCAGDKCDDFFEPGTRTSCTDRDDERLVREAVLQLVDTLEVSPDALVGPGQTEIDSMDQFIAALPQKVRQQPLFMTETRAMARIYPRSERKRLRDGDPLAVREFVDRDGKWCTTVDGELGHCLEARVLLPSVSADVIGSFTTHPDSPAANRFEMAIFDPADSRLSLIDVQFLADLDGDGDIDPVVEKNPPTCMRCHGGFDGTVNYRFDPYRFWAYMTPFNEDVIRAGSIEASWYRSFLTRIDQGEDKLGQLAPLNDLDSMNDALGVETLQLAAEDAPVDFSGFDSPALNFSHQLLERNACRVGADLAERHDVETLKFAAAAALLGCDDIERYFARDQGYTIDVAARHFEAMQEGITGGRFDYDTFVAETRAKQGRLLHDRLSRRYDHFEEFAGQDIALSEMLGVATERAVDGHPPGFGITNFERFDKEIANARFVLEPLGVDVTNWSMAVDPAGQSHVEFLFPLYLQPMMLSVFRDILDERGVRSPLLDPIPGFCQDLNTGGDRPARQCRDFIRDNQQLLCTALEPLSQNAFAAMSGQRVDALQTQLFVNGTLYEVEDRVELEALAEDRARCISADELAVEALQALESKCGQCHNSGYDEGSPLLPFDDLIALETHYRRGESAAIRGLYFEESGDPMLIGTTFVSADKGPYEFEYVTLAERIWDRINRHPLKHGAMPPAANETGLVLNRLSEKQKAAIRGHQLQVLGAVTPDPSDPSCPDDSGGLPEL